MAKIDLEALSIEELASLRDKATEKLAEKVAARQAELEAELERLSQYGKPARKSLIAHQETAALFHDPDIEGAIRRAVL
jgi:DNA-binding protein H-NS